MGEVLEQAPGAILGFRLRGDLDQRHYGGAPRALAPHGGEDRADSPVLDHRGHRAGRGIGVGVESRQERLEVREARFREDGQDLGADE